MKLTDENQDYPDHRPGPYKGTIPVPDFIQKMIDERKARLAATGCPIDGVSIGTGDSSTENVGVKHAEGQIDPA